MESFSWVTLRSDVFFQPSPSASHTTSLVGRMPWWWTANLHSYFWTEEATSTTKRDLSYCTKHEGISKLLTVTVQKDQSGIGVVAESGPSLIPDGTTKHINKVLYFLSVSSIFYSRCCQTLIITITGSYLSQTGGEAFRKWRNSRLSQAKNSYDFPQGHTALQSPF